MTLRRTELKRTSSLLRSPFRSKPRAVLTAPVVDTARQDPALPKSAPRKRSQAADPISRATTKAVRERSGDCCEACGVWLPVGRGNRHHRQKRRFGNHGPENVVLLCSGPGTADCHRRVHQDRDGEASARGWVVKQWEDPSLIPFVRWDEPKFTEKLR